MEKNIPPDDAFAEMARMRERSNATRQEKSIPVSTIPVIAPVEEAAAKPSGTRDEAPIVTPTPLDVKKPEADQEEEDTQGGREFLVGVYVDGRMDDFLEHYVSQRIEGTRKKPSRSLVAFWLMQIGMQALEAQGRPPMPREFTKRRRQ